jgi:Zn-dependent protease
MLLDIASLLVLFFSVMIHEIAHGYTAYRFGDPTARLSGRLTLNPLKHVDPLGTIVVPLLLYLAKSHFLFGWAKPVPINESNFRDPQRQIPLCAAAGPLSNFTLAAICSILLRNIGLPTFFQELLAQSIMINIVLACFNLIPLPPLDGSRIFAGLLPYRLQQQYYKIEPYGTVILFLLLYVGLFNYFFQWIQPIFRWFF